MAIILLGIILTPTPLPIGIILIGLGFTLLVNVSPAPIRWLRARWKWFDLRLHDLERFLPEVLAKPLRRTDCDHDEDEAPEPSAKLSFIDRLKRSNRLQ